VRCALQIKLGPSFLIPNSQIGTFGSVTAFKSMVRSRADLFDVAAAGPVAGGITASVFLAIGIVLSSYTDEVSRVSSRPGLLGIVEQLPRLAYELRTHDFECDQLYALVILRMTG
jgi:hypothetical protein